MTKRDTAEAEAARQGFLNTYGSIAVRDGMPAAAGRIAALLYLSSEPVSFSSLARELGASRGSISTNTRLLEQLGVIERLAVAGRREHHFQAARHADVRAIEGFVQRYGQALRAMTAARQRLGALPGPIEERLLRIEQLHRLMMEHFTQIAETLEP